MEFDQLQAFLSVAREGSITRAASIMGMKQPALSKIIFAMERELGEKLFYRQQGRMLLSPYGEIVKNRATQIFALRADAQVHLQELQGILQPEVRVNASFSPADPNWLLETIGAYLEVHPSVHMTHRICQLPEIRQQLLQREVDVAITTSEIRSREIAWTPLYQESLGVVMSRDNPLSRKPELWLSDLAEENFYCINASSDQQHFLLTVCRKAGFEPNIQLEAELPIFVAECVSRNLGVTFSSGENLLRSWHPDQRYSWEDNLVYRTLRDSSLRRVRGIAVLSDRHITKTVQDFIGFLNATEKPEA